MTSPNYIYHSCVKASISWFEAHGWELVNLYQEDGIDMAHLRHVEITDEDEDD